jgi:hypothetical protein
MVYGSIYNSLYSISEGQFDPTYAMPDGPDLMAEEAMTFDQRMFDVMIEHDFIESATINGMISESTLTAIDESFVTDVWEKIKEFIIKIKNKIVSIAKAAAVKLNAFFIKDNGALLEKYGKQFDNADKSKIEIKGWREYKEHLNADDFNFVEAFDKACYLPCRPGETKEGKRKEYEKEYSADKMLSKVLGRNTTTGSFRKDAESKCFGSEKTVKAESIKSTITSALKNYNSAVEQINNTKKTAEDQLSANEDKADKMKRAADNKTAEDDANTNIKDIMTMRADCAKYACSQYSTFISKIFSAQLDLEKTYAKQARKAFIKVASSGAAKMESTLMEAEMDVSDYEVDSFFDQYSYDYEDLIA